MYLEMHQELEKKGYVLCKQFLRKELAEYLAYQILQEKEKGLMSCDTQVTHSSFRYNMPLIRTLHLYEQERVSSLCNKQLTPTYCYTRIYYKDSDLKPHKDRDACEYSITLHIQGSEPWEIYMEDFTTKEHIPIILDPGDAVLYKGCDIVHYRKPFQGEYYIQCFLHYVDEGGEKRKHVEPETKIHTRYIPIPCVRKIHEPLPPIIVEALQKIQTFIPVSTQCQLSAVINEHVDPILHAQLHDQILSQTLFYRNEHVLSVHYSSHDILRIEASGVYQYQMNDVKTFYYSTLYCLEGSCSLSFPAFNTCIEIAPGEMVILPISYAYRCILQGECTILRSVLI